MTIDYNIKMFSIQLFFKYRSCIAGDEGNFIYYLVIDLPQDILEMNNFNYDPYAILQIDRNSSIKDVKSAFKTLAKVYHPDKGGHPEMFRMLKEAYNTIIRFIEGQSGRESGHMGDRNPKEHLAELMQEQKVMQRGTMDHRNFSRDRFNAEFESQRNINNDFVYNVDLGMANNMGKKTFDQLQRERSSMNVEIGQIKPLFNHGKGFDPNTFNRIFEKYKQPNDNSTGGDGGALIPYQDPTPLTSHGDMGFSHAMQPHGGEMNFMGGGFAPIGGDEQTQMFHHPTDVNQNTIQDYRNLPDITQVNSMARDEIKNRMNDYRNQSFDVAQGGHNLNNNMGMGVEMGAGIGSGMGTIRDAPRALEYNSGDSRNEGSRTGEEIEALRQQLNDMQLKMQQFDEMERKVKIQDRLIKKIHQVGTPENRGPEQNQNQNQHRQSQNRGQGRIRRR
jgi:hypothetical protein